MAIETHSDVTVANVALVSMGEKTIASFDDENDRARTVKAIYFQVRQYMLSIYPWQFAMAKGVQLSRDTVTPTTQWKYKFRLPPDRLNDDMRAIYTDASEGARPIIAGFEVADENVFSDHETLYADYVKDKAESDWPPYFVEAVKDYFGMQVAVPITDQETTAARFKKNFEGEGNVPGSFDRAKSADAQPGQIQIIQDSPFVNARHGGIGGVGW